jgi:NAD(P)H-nitrite reductase large subunit
VKWLNETTNAAASCGICCSALVARIYDASCGQDWRRSTANDHGIEKEGNLLLL